MIKYVLFGAGEKGVNALHFFGHDRVEFFCDNSQHKIGECIEGVPIIAVSELFDLVETDYKVIITTVKPQNIYSISKQLKEIGVDFELFENEAKELIREDIKVYQSKNRRGSFEYNADTEYLICWDRCDSAGDIKSYFWQDLWAAQRIYRNRVNVHYDIGSRLDGFIAHLISFQQRVCMIDIRPLNQKIKGMDFIRSDATELDAFEDESIDSLSALCSLEHFGLGRYGDPIDPEACFKCFAAIQRKIKKGGHFYLSVPIGRECVCFNAHRVFSIETILQEFNKMDLIELSTCFQNDYEENLKDYHKYDDWFDREGDRMGLFWFRKK